GPSVWSGGASGRTAAVAGLATTAGRSTGSRSRSEPPSPPLHPGGDGARPIPPGPALPARSADSCSSYSPQAAPRRKNPCHCLLSRRYGACHRRCGAVVRQRANPTVGRTTMKRKILWGSAGALALLVLVRVVFGTGGRAEGAYRFV